MKKILVLTDLSPAARSAAGLGLALAGQSGARLVVLNAWTPPLLIEVPDAAAYPLEAEWVEQHEPHQQLHAEALRLYQLQQKMRPAQPAVIETISHRGTLMQAIETHLSTIEPDLILIGHDPVEEGQLTRNWLSRLKYPLMVVPACFRQDGPVKTIAFATDLHLGDELILSKLKLLSDELHSRIAICHISKPTFNMAAGEELKIAGFVKAMTKAGISSAAYEQRYSRSIAREIELFAERKHASLLALVHRRHGWLWSILHQSNEAGVLAYGRLPVLLMPE